MSTITPEMLARSVIAVPPLARRADLQLDRRENERLVRYLAAGGVTTLLYGGNAVLYHVAVSQYAALLEMLAGWVQADNLIIPSVGPAYGTMLDQAPILRSFPFPTAMVLPQREIATSAGAATGIRRFAEAYGKPVVVYLKHEGYLDVPDVQRLDRDGVVSWIKYAMVRQDPGRDDYLRALVGAVDPRRIVSGIGEQPAVVHLRDFGLIGYTSGCVCVAPRQSLAMLRALAAGDITRAETLRAIFRPLEDLRNRIHPIRVLHAAVALAGVCQTGPILPLLSPLDAADQAEVERAARELRRRDEEYVA